MKKCLVLDLDNTPWGVVVGEDGIEGIALSLTNLSKNILSII
jgi:predicted enzyme involved in methoxymalonyl-ACP biosynthesis